MIVSSGRPVAELVNIVIKGSRTINFGSAVFYCAISSIGRASEF